MSRFLTAVTMLGLLGLMLGLASNSEPEGASSPTIQDQRTFEGVARCKTCHRKPEQGEQFRLWEESAHAKAFATLATDEAKAIAAEKGIEDPQTADACLKCHVTAYDAAEELLGRRHSIEDGVGCESCHGAGGDYYKKKTMKAIYAGEIDGASVGLIEPTEELCVACHNEESPTYKEFVYDERVAEIAHPTPEGGSPDSDED